MGRVAAAIHVFFARGQDPACGSRLDRIAGKDAGWTVNPRYSRHAAPSGVRGRYATMNSPAARATQERPSSAAARTRCDVTGPGEVVYIIEGDSLVRERLFTELTASDVAVQSFECPYEYRFFDRGDSAACIVFDVQLLEVIGID